MGALTVTAVLASMLAFEPSLRIVVVDDDNINYSDEAPLHDQIRRVTPELALRIDSPRFSARASYGFDHETYASNPALDDPRARQRAGFALEYEASERLTLTAGAGWMDTNTLTDLNTQTGLPSSRIRAERLSFGPSLRYRVAPRVTATAAFTSTRTATDRESVSSQVQTLSFERRMSSRDVVAIGYEHSAFEFDGETRLRMNADAAILRWTRDLSPRSQFSIQAGPRFTDRSTAVDFAVSMTREWNELSLATTLQRNQTILIGYSGLVDAESLESRLAWTPHRRFTAYVSPAAFRTTHEDLEGIVYRIGAGVRFALTDIVAFDAAYSSDTQNGAIDPLRSDLELSHSVLSIGLTVTPRDMP